MNNFKRFLTPSRLKFNYDCLRTVSCRSPIINNKILFDINKVCKSNSRQLSISSKLNNPNESKSKDKLNLMNFPKVLIPSIFQLMRLRLSIKYNIRTIDPEFTFDSFSVGAKQVNKIKQN